MCFSLFLKMGKDSAARIELGRSFHQEGTFNLKVCESDFVPLWDGTIKRRSGVNKATRCALVDVPNWMVKL